MTNGVVYIITFSTLYDDYFSDTFMEAHLDFTEAMNRAKNIATTYDKDGVYGYCNVKGYDLLIHEIFLNKKVEPDNDLLNE